VFLLFETEIFWRPESKEQLQFREADNTLSQFLSERYSQEVVSGEEGSDVESQRISVAES
jgi:hypothetical protein